MSLRDGAETVVNQCLDVKQDEEVVVLNDGNDQDLIDSLLEVLGEVNDNHELIEYKEPERHGEEPPEEVARKMKQSDVIIAPTRKSITHTDARRNATEAGARCASLATINREIWNGALQADYERVKEITLKVYEMLSQTSKVRIETPSGTELELKVDTDYYIKGTGFYDSPGDFGNLPAGETFGPGIETEGVVVVDNLVPAPEAEGAKVEIRDNEVVAVESEEENKLEEVFDNVDGARNIAEFGFGTNPEATLIGNILQDEKVLGTVHIAFGDNSSYVPEGDERRVEAEIHWDTVLEQPTVWFDDRKVLDRGEPVFMKDL